MRFWTWLSRGFAGLCLLCVAAAWDYAQTPAGLRTAPPWWLGSANLVLLAGLVLLPLCSLQELFLLVSRCRQLAAFAVSLLLFCATWMTLGAFLLGGMAKSR